MSRWGAGHCRCDWCQEARERRERERKRADVTEVADALREALHEPPPKPSDTIAGEVDARIGDTEPGDPVR